MDEKTVLIIEDRDDHRKLLDTALADAHFKVFSAATVEEGREILRELKDLDVAVLDMRLEEPGITGAEFGIEIRNHFQSHPPQFLIYSQYDDAHYYRLALELGAATYLLKVEKDVDDVVRHVKALSLIRALSYRPITTKMFRIAEKSGSIPNGLSRICQEVLFPELEAILANRFLLLLTDGEVTHCFSRRNLPEKHPAFDGLQRLTFGHTSYQEATVMDMANLPFGYEWKDESLFGKLQGTALIPLYKSEDFKLGIGIVPEGLEPYNAGEAAKLASVLGQYFQPALLDQLIRVTNILADHFQREELHKATAQLCLDVGQAQLKIFDKAVEEGEIQSNAKELKKLRVLGQELRDAGEMLTHSFKTHPGGLDSSGSKLKLLKMRNLIQWEWDDLVERNLIKAPESLAVVDDCTVIGDEESLQIATSRILQWFARRMDSNTPEGRPSLTVTCSEDRRYSMVLFEDKSRRMPRPLREKLFSPFRAVLIDDADTGRHLGLYLAKMLVEVENKGRLEDRTHELEVPEGHRWLMRFPKN